MWASVWMRWIHLWIDLMLIFTLGDVQSVFSFEKFITHLSIPISERPAERGRDGGREEHVFGFILETESHIIPCRLRIPYHPLQKTHRYASRARPCWAVLGSLPPLGMRHLSAWNKIKTQMACGDPEVTSNHVIRFKPGVSPSEVTHPQWPEFWFFILIKGLKHV